MINVLCLDTSSAYCSVALHANGTTYERTEQLGRTHNENLLPMLDGLLDGAGISPTDIDLVGFAAGPGSFTGVRIAAAATQGIALAAGAQVVALRSAQVLALSGSTHIDDGAHAVVAIRSRGEAFYLSLWRRVGPAVLCVREDELVDALDDWHDHQNDQVLGELPPWWANPDRLQAVQPNARSMIEPVIEQFEAGCAGGPASALPVYIDGDSPWRKRSH